MMTKQQGMLKILSYSSSKHSTKKGYLGEWIVSNSTYKGALKVKLDNLANVKFVEILSFNI